jgi:hypothetical protein
MAVTAFVISALAFVISVIVALAAWRQIGLARHANASAVNSLAIADGLRVPEHAELGDVPAEQQRHRPVRDDAELP